MQQSKTCAIGTPRPSTSEVERSRCYTDTTVHTKQPKVSLHQCCPVNEEVNGESGFPVDESFGIATLTCPLAVEFVIGVPFQSSYQALRLSFRR